MRRRFFQDRSDARASVRGVLLLLVVALVAGPLAAQAACAGTDPAFEACCCGCESTAGQASLEAPPCGCHVEPLPDAPTVPSRDVTVLPQDSPALVSWSDSIVRPAPTDAFGPTRTGREGTAPEALTQLRGCVLLL